MWSWFSLVEKELKENVVRFLPILSRLCHREIKGNIDISILNVHMVTEEKLDKEK